MNLIRALFSCCCCADENSWLVSVRQKNKTTKQSSLPLFTKKTFLRNKKQENIRH